MLVIVVLLNSAGVSVQMLVMVELLPIRLFASEYVARIHTHPHEFATDFSIFYRFTATTQQRLLESCILGLASEMAREREKVRGK